MTVFTHKCPNCDAPLTFNPDSQEFHCDYCLSNFTTSQLTGPENPADSIKQSINSDEVPFKENPLMDATLYTCPSCGAEIVTDSTTAATTCYYCHNPVILSGRLDGNLLPDAIIPFSIGKERAVQQFLEWAQKKKFVPKDFFNKKQVEKITGVYFPYWIVNGEVAGEVRGDTTSKKTWRNGETEYTEVSYYHSLRKGKVSFSDSLRNALVKENLETIEGVHPYDFSAMKKFSTSYLAGFQAEKRNKEFDEFKEKFEQDFNQFSESTFKNSLKNSKDQIQLSLDKPNINARYVLLPVWILNYQKDNYTYSYVMNGQTGKFFGELPLDERKLKKVFAGLAGILFLLFLIGGL